MAGAVFGEVQVSLFVAGAVFGEIWNDSRSAKCCIFQYKMLVVGVKSNLGCEAGCGLTVSCSDHGRIGRALQMTVHPFSANFSEILDGHFSSQAQYLVSLDYVTHVALRIVNNVSCVTRISHGSHFSWQAQYLVSLDNDTCCSAHCK